VLKSLKKSEVLGVSKLGCGSKGGNDNNICSTYQLSKYLFYPASKLSWSGTEINILERILRCFVLAQKILIS